MLVFFQKILNLISGTRVSGGSSSTDSETCLYLLSATVSVSHYSAIHNIWRTQQDLHGECSHLQSSPMPPHLSGQSLGGRASWQIQLASHNNCKSGCHVYKMEQPSPHLQNWVSILGILFSFVSVLGFLGSSRDLFLWNNVWYKIKLLYTGT